MKKKLLLNFCFSEATVLAEEVGGYVKTFTRNCTADW
jgi:hypothetical protein